MSQSSLDRILSDPNLPTLPVVAMRVLELTSRQEVSLREIAKVIENDPAIATRVLRSVNSSYYALSNRCGSIQQALVFLGIQTVKALVLGFSLARNINGGGDDEVSFDFVEYWRRSLYVAAAAREIAIMHRRCDPDEAFIGALVQDLGMVALWRTYGDRYLQVIDLANGDHRRLSAIETRSFEIDHTTVSSEILTRWRFPESIISAVRSQHRTHDASTETSAIAQTIELAGCAAAVLTLKQPQAELIRFRRDGQEQFELRSGPLTLLLQRIATQADELSRAFGLDVGVQADVSGLLKAAAQIRSEQGLVEHGLEVDASDLVESGSITIDSIPDARAFGTSLEEAFLAHSTNMSEGAGTAESATPHASIGLLLIGIDRARKVQEAYGTRGVEAAMTHALHMVHAVEGAQLTPYRFVGAEIAVILPTTDVEELCRIAELIRRKFADTAVPFASATGRSFPASVSIGGALYDADEAVRSEVCIHSPDQLVRGAMFALANGRKARNRVVMFHQNLATESQL